MMGQRSWEISVWYWKGTNHMGMAFLQYPEFLPNQITISLVTTSFSSFIIYGRQSEISYIFVLFVIIYELQGYVVLLMVC